MEVQLVSAGKGWQWIVEGYALFRKSPAMWFAITLLLGVVWLVSMIIPLLLCAAPPPPPSGGDR